MSLIGHFPRPQLLIHLKVFRGHIKKCLYDSEMVGCIMLDSMTSELEAMGA